MHNTFITKDFDWGFDGGSRNVRLANRLLKLFRRRAVVRASGSTGYMTSVEQRINLYHMVSQVLAYDVPGDFLEVGTFTGQTAVLITRILQEEARSPRTMHVYDAFTPSWGEPDPRGRLEQNFRERNLPLPEIHAGYFSETMPSQLPERIAFVNIDCGFGGDPQQHADVIYEVLGHLYPRLAKGAIVSLIDYWHPVEYKDIENINPGVQPGCDRFLEGKPEKVSVLYAAEYCQGYFRKL